MNLYIFSAHGSWTTGIGGIVAETLEEAIRIAKEQTESEDELVEGVIISDLIDAQAYSELEEAANNSFSASRLLKDWLNDRGIDSYTTIWTLDHVLEIRNQNQGLLFYTFNCG